MAEKQIVFTDQDQIKIEGIVIDKDKEEAIKYLNYLVQCFKGTEGHSCAPKWAK
jgi:hypothetical protein